MKLLRISATYFEIEIHVLYENRTCKLNNFTPCLDSTLNWVLLSIAIEVILSTRHESFLRRTLHIVSLIFKTQEI